MRTRSLYMWYTPIFTLLHSGSLLGHTLTPAFHTLTSQGEGWEVSLAEISPRLSSMSTRRQEADRKDIIERVSTRDSALIYSSWKRRVKITSGGKKRSKSPRQSAVSTCLGQHSRGDWGRESAQLPAHFSFRQSQRLREENAGSQAFREERIMSAKTSAQHSALMRGGKKTSAQHGG